MLPSEWEKRLVDLNVDNLTEEDLKWVDYVFVSAMIALLPHTSPKIR